MRNSRKILVALFVLMALLMSMTTIFASAASTDVTVYLTPNNNWKTDNARFAIYTWGGPAGEKWINMTDSNKDGVYEATLPAGYSNLIFCRMNPSSSSNGWSNKWNQTKDLTLPTNGANHYTVAEGAWDKGGGSWSTFGSTCNHVLGDAATCTTAQVCTICNDPIVSALGHDFNSSNVCKRCGSQATFTVAGDGAHLGSEWDTGNTANDMTYSNGVYTKVYTNVAAGSYALKCVREHEWGVAYGNPNSGDKDGNYLYTVATAGSTVTVTLKGETVEVKVTTPGSDDETPDHTHNFVYGKCECGETDPTYTVETITIYFENNWLWSNVKCYYWPEDGHVWPGVEMTVVGTLDGHDVYAAVIPADVHGIVFNGNKHENPSETDKSPDIKTGIVNGAGWKMEWDGENKVVSISFTPETPDHTHTFVEGKCECGETDPDYVPETPDHTHTFVEGKCECGETDPNYVPETPVVPQTEYYLVG